MCDWWGVGWSWWVVADRVDCACFGGSKYAWLELEGVITGNMHLRVVAVESVLRVVAGCRVGCACGGYRVGCACGGLGVFGVGWSWRV